MLWWFAGGLAGIAGFVVATVLADTRAGHAVPAPWWGWLAAGIGVLCVDIGIVDALRGLFSG